MCALFALPMSAGVSSSDVGQHPALDVRLAAVLPVELALQPIHGAGLPWSEVLLRPRQESPERLVSRAVNERWVLALDQAVIRAAVPRMHQGCRYSLNASPLSLLDPDYVDTLLETPWLHHATQPQLVLEVLEWPTLTAAQRRRACSTLRVLRAMGVLVALDDVGVTPHPIPVHEADLLKLDRSLIEALRDGQQPLARSNIRHWIELGVPVVAEGIESAADLARVQDLGVEFWQGHHGGHPRAWESHS